MNLDMWNMVNRAGRLMVVSAAASFILSFFCPLQKAICAEGMQGRVKVLTEAREPVSIHADSIEYNRKAGTFTAVGDVNISQGDITLTAEKATLNEVTGDAEAEGKARLVRDGDVLFAERIKVNFNTQLGVIEQGNIFVQRGNYHISGASLRRVSGQEYEVLSGGLTTCDAEHPFWKVTADYLTVRMDKDVEAKGVVMRIKGIPVLYTPYAWFPLIKPRTTGFLLPGAGYSTKEGFRFVDSFYWAPADNFDATFTADYRARRGLGVGSEFRLALDKDTLSRLRAYYMDDRKDNQVRYNLELKHQQVFSDTLSGRADVNLSDRQYYRNLTDTARERTQRSVDSNAFLTNRWDWGRAYLFGQYTLGLDLNNDVIVQRLPDLGINVVKKQLFEKPVYMDVDTSAAYFYKRNGVSGGRYDIFPKFSGAFNLAGVNVSPRVGYRETVYSLEGEGRAEMDDERGLFGAGVNVQTGFYRLYGFGDGPLAGIRHTIEPQVAYNYVMKRGGALFPKFDGIDTLGRRNLVAYSITNRFVLKYRDGRQEPRVDYFTLRLSQFCDLYRDNRVFGSRRSLSALYGEVIYKAGSLFTVNNDFRYDIYSGTFLSVDTDIRFDGIPGRLWFGIGQRFSTDADQTYISPSRYDFFTPSTDFVSDFVITSRSEAERVNFLTAETGVKVSKNWEVGAKVWYDVHTASFRETDVSATYTSQCWGVKVSYVNRPGERQVMAAINLKGLGSVKI